MVNFQLPISNSQGVRMHRRHRRRRLGHGCAYRATGGRGDRRQPWRLSRCASHPLAWAGGPTCWPTRSTVPASSRSPLAIPAPRKSARPSPPNMAAARFRVTRPFSPTRTSRPSSIPRRMACISRPRARRPMPASMSFSTNPSPTRFPTAAGSPSSVARRAWCWPWAVNAAANISRDRLGKIDLGSWRYQAAGMPGGVMLQIGIHYTDVLEYLIGPVRAVRGQFAQLVLPGDNPDVASLLLQHDNGALSTLNASYASASEHYLMNIYGKEATAYYDIFEGLRMLKRGEEKPVKVPFANTDTIAEELEEFADAIQGGGAPEVGGEYATTSLAVIRAGIVSAREGRHVEIAEILAKDRYRWTRPTARYWGTAATSSWRRRSRPCS